MFFIFLLEEGVKNGPREGAFHVFHFFFFSFFPCLFFLEKKLLLFLFPCIPSENFHCWQKYQSLIVDVSSVVGAPWRCGVMTTQAGIGLGRLLGGEHASTPQSGVEAPRLLKRSLPRLYYCFVLNMLPFLKSRNPQSLPHTDARIRPSKNSSAHGVPEFSCLVELVCRPHQAR